MDYQMDKAFQVVWTKRSLLNAIAIKNYLILKFSKKELSRFESLLRQFELTVSNFPTLYPESKSQKNLRRAIIHKHTTVYYIFDENKVTVIALKDNRQEKAS
jgi:plasmid stabilization system protein ParE